MIRADVRRTHPGVWYASRTKTNMDTKEKAELFDILIELAARRGWLALTRDEMTTYHDVLRLSVGPLASQRMTARMVSRAEVRAARCDVIGERWRDMILEMQREEQ